MRQLCAMQQSATAQHLAPFSPHSRIAVIGAGMAGLACTRQLVLHGHHVELFDKGRSPGGRLATRRDGTRRIDHGAQFATARGPGFRALIETLNAANAVTPWPAASRPEDTAWVGIPGMSAFARALLESIGTAHVTLHSSAHVSRIEADLRLRVHPAAEAKPGSVSDQGGMLSAAFDAVLLALPAPQAIPLLGTVNHPFSQALQRVEIAPCWAAMLVLDTPIAAPDVLRPAHGPLAWIARDSARPGRDPSAAETWVLHAAPDWSRTHLEDDGDTVAAALIAAFNAATGQSCQPAGIATHRWRYALTETPLGEACLWDAEARIGVCGDWCLGKRIEAAFDSGTALAETVCTARVAA